MTDSEKPCPRPLSTAVFTTLQDATAINTALLAAWRRESQAQDLRRSHHFHGRFENIYIPFERIPECGAVIDAVLAAARTYLGRKDLRFGFWFNWMQPGEKTTLHSHEELDELLSAVYYVSCAAGCGNLVLHEDHATVQVTPEPGMLVLFPPDLPHEVTTNASEHPRLSIAFNIGPLSVDC